MPNSEKVWDCLIKNATVFDGSGELPRVEDVAVCNGGIQARGIDLPESAAGEVVDGSGQWLMPGLLDIHTHFDLEVELAPGLPEAVRHGTTTVVVSNCSLGTCYGAQRRGEQDPIVDCFARVENIPKPVLKKVADAVDWHDSAGYLEHFDHINLGPNIVPLIPHSMLRIEVMGLQESISREPTETELREMENLVEKGMQEGYAGFSTDALPFHYLANDPNRRSKIPTQFGSYGELKRLTHVVRRHDRVWQATPPKDNRFQVIRNFLLTSGRLFGKPLRLTPVAALDLHTNRALSRLGVLLGHVLNSRLINGRFRMQALSAPFTVWADGAITPLSEEIPELRELNEPDLEDSETRRAILRDPDYRERFRQMWYRGKSGFNIANLKRMLRMEDEVLNRRLDDMYFASGGPDDWREESMESVYKRLVRWQGGDASAARSDAEREAFEAFRNPVGDDCTFFLHLLEHYDTDIRWHVTIANRDPDTVKKLLFHPKLLPGFNDSGAHLTNMAFYDGNLRTLKLAAEEGLACVAQQVRRLSAEPAEFFGLNVGRIDLGAQADLLMVDPKALESYVPEDCVGLIHRDVFEYRQMVNRVPGVVRQVMIAGRFAWRDDDFTAEFGARRFGRVLRHKDHPREQTVAPASPQPARRAA